ncbi:hypothetical protein BJV74DRAFT_813899 [Russula compacta]|nr:hypothetical protein BJV74DRAFT_813899 [Russula compacta]
MVPDSWGKTYPWTAHTLEMQLITACILANGRDRNDRWDRAGKEPTWAFQKMSLENSVLLASRHPSFYALQKQLSKFDITLPVLWNERRVIPSITVPNRDSVPAIITPPSLPFSHPDDTTPHPTDEPPLIIESSHPTSQVSPANISTHFHSAAAPLNMQLEIPFSFLPSRRLERAVVAISCAHVLRCGRVLNEKNISFCCPSAGSVSLSGIDAAHSFSF